jgi:hypothetical protein
MNTLTKITLLLAIAVVATAAAPASASAAASCHSINAKGIGQDNGNLTTNAQIIGGGLLHGTTAAAFTPTGFSFPEFLFTGTITFTTNNGTLTASLTGSLNVVTGEFAATTTGMSGTGQLAGVTGQLTLRGVEDLATLAFTEDVTGEICVDLAP